VGVNRCLWAALVVIVSSAARVEPCTTMRPISPEEIVRGAESIVRAAAVEYAGAPKDPTVWTTGEPDSRVRFKIVEVVKGDGLSSEVVLPGYLVDRDDFNDVKVPYSFVRPGGRSGSCFANSYRTGSEYLLMLKRRADGMYTVNWYALGPVNEQLRPNDDPWLAWVRERVRRRRAQRDQPPPWHPSAGRQGDLSSPSSRRLNSSRVDGRRSPSSSSS
jgi:hypothetical protein